MSTELQDIAVDFQHFENTVLARFVVNEISYLGNVDTAKCQFKQEIDAYRPTRLVIDFEQVTYISTSGIRMLLNVLTQMKCHSGEVHLCNLSRIIRTTLEITNLTKVFKIFPDRQAAIMNDA